MRRTWKYLVTRNFWRAVARLNEVTSQRLIYESNKLEVDDPRLLEMLRRAAKHEAIAMRARLKLDTALTELGL